MTAIPSERLYSSREVARRVGVSLETVQGWARSGLIRAVRVGEQGRYRIPERELERLLGASVLTQALNGEEAAA